MARRPEAKTTTDPRALRGSVPNSRKVPPRPPDRGGYTSVAGYQTILPHGVAGGTPSPPKPLAVVGAVPIIPANNAEAQRMTKLAQKASAVAAGRLKLQVRLTPGPSALAHAKRGPVRIDPRGRELLRGSLSPDLVRAKERARGVFAGHMTAPLPAKVDLIRGRIRRELRGAGGAPTETGNDPRHRSQTGAMDMERKRAAEAVVRRLQSFGSATPVNVASGDTGQTGQATPVKAGPEDVATVAAYESGGGMERILFLVGACVVGFMVLKKG